MKMSRFRPREQQSIAAPTHMPPALSSPRPRSSPSMSHAAQPPVVLEGIVPAALLTRCFEYTAAPADPIAHCDRHRDLPAVYRNGRAYLFDALQQRQLAQLFPPDRAAQLIFPGAGAESTHPLIQSKGEARIYNQRSPRLDPPFTEKSLAACLAQSSDFVLSELLPSASHLLHANCVFLHAGPALFKPLNLLDDLRPKLPSHDHSLAQFNIARGDTHTNAHTDWYGTDAVVVQGVGEKLWLTAPPERTSDFLALFPPTARFDLNSQSTREKLQVLSSWTGSAALHAKEGDVLFVPGGWPHLVKNLTRQTASLGWSYLRAWKLQYCIQWAAERSKDEALSKVNLEGLFEKLIAPSAAFLGISADRAAEMKHQWARLELAWTE